MPQTPPPLLGFNNNVRHHGRIFHIQTEDSGVKRPHIISHLFGDGGRILKTVRTDYSEHLGREDMTIVVRRLMKEQHKALFVALRSGELDEIIENAFGPPLKAEPKPPSVRPPAAGEPAFDAPVMTPEELAERAPPLPQEWLVTPPSRPLWDAPSAPEHAPPPAPELDIPPLVVPPTPTVSGATAVAAQPASSPPDTLPGTRKTPLLHPQMERPAPPPRLRQRGTPPPLPQRKHAPTPRPPSSPTPISPGRPPSAPGPLTPLPPSHSIERAVEAMAAKVAGRKPRDSVPDEGPLSQPGELQRRRPPPQQPSGPPESPGRYSISRPSTIFGETPADSTRSLFGDPLIGEKSLDEVILSYLAEDLENPPK